MNVLAMKLSIIETLKENYIFWNKDFLYFLLEV